MSKLAIVTDSTADIPEELSARHHIHVVPNYVILREQSLVDGKDISRQEFYASLPSMDPLPTTATASAGDYQALYDKIFRNGFTQILSIHCSGFLSGIINAARSAAQTYGNRIHVVDSQFVSLGLGFQVLAAAEAALSHPVERVLDLLAELRKRVRVIAMLDTLEYLRRSGRVSWARARLGDILHIKPFVEVKEGRISSLGEARTRQKAIQRLLEMARKLGPLERLAILHTNAETDARALLNALVAQVSTEPLLVNITTVIGTHVGPNGLGIAAVVKR